MKHLNLNKLFRRQDRENKNIDNTGKQNTAGNQDDSKGARHRPRKSHKKRIGILMAVVLLIAASAVFASGKPLYTEVVTAEAGDASIWFSETGTVTSGDAYKIYSGSAGKVASVYVTEGQFVEAGTVIAQLDTSAYQAEIALHSANIRSYQIQGDLSAQTVSLEEIQQQLSYQKEQLDTFSALYAEGAVSKSEYESHQQDYELLQTKLVQAQGQRSGEVSSYAAMADGERASIELLQQQLAACSIVADRSGYILELPIANQSYVDAQAPVCILEDDGGYLIETYVATEDMVYIAEGDQAELIQEHRQGETSYGGTIQEIGNRAQEQQSSLGVSEYRVKVLLKPDEELAASVRNGYNVTVRFSSYVNQDAILLPATAFFRTGEQDWVFTADEDGILELVAVEKGPSVLGRTVVLSGIARGDLVVADAGLNGIAEGVKIRWE